MMAAAANFKIRKIAISLQSTTDFDEIWYNDAHGPSRHRQPIKIQERTAQQQTKLWIRTCHASSLSSFTGVESCLISDWVE